MSFKKAQDRIKKAEGFVQIAQDHWSFELEGKLFVPWGLNYDRSIYGGNDHILEEMMDLAPHKVDEDFRIARDLGSNVIRIFPHVGCLQKEFGEISEREMEKLDHTIELAKKNDQWVDITGLSHIDTSNLPKWYFELSDKEIIEGEALVWETIARRYANEPAVFCYNLQNEPFINYHNSDVVTVGSFTMRDGREFSYCNAHFKDVEGEWARWVETRYSSDKELRVAWGDFPLEGETYDSPRLPVHNGDRGFARYKDWILFREELAYRWTDTMVRAIRKHDSHHLITLGFLPTGIPLCGEAHSGFNPQLLAPLLDFVCIHLYPQFPTTPGRYIEESRYRLEMLLRACFAGKPVVVEEWNALGGEYTTGQHSATEWFDLFMKQSEDDASGWLTFYHAMLEDTVDLATGELSNGWVGKFKSYAPGVKETRYERAPGKEIWRFNRFDYFYSKDCQTALLNEYIDAEKQGCAIDIDFT